MTAPLYLNRPRKSVTIHIVTNNLLNYIDNDDIEEVERYTNRLFKFNVSWELLLLLLRYAKDTKQTKSYIYLQQIIMAKYNIWVEEEEIK